MKIAIHLPGGLGDEVCLTPTYRALKEKYPNCEITAHVSHPEILLMNPYVDHLSNCNRNFYFNRKMYDKYIYMFWQANKRQCFSYMHLCDWFASQADVKLKDRSLIFNLGDSDREFLNSYNFPKNRPIISFDAYGNKESNKWSFKNFITTIDYLHEKHNAFVVQIGLQDYGIKNADLNLVRKLNIRQLAAMIERSDLYIGNDSGAAHIASAVRTTSVKIFGCTDPACYIHNENEYPVVSDIECQGCQNKKPCQNPIHKKSVSCPGEQFACIKIPVEAVFETINLALRKEQVMEEIKTGGYQRVKEIKRDEENQGTEKNKEDRKILSEFFESINKTCNEFLEKIKQNDAITFESIYVDNNDNAEIRKLKQTIFEIQNIQNLVSTLDKVKIFEYNPVENELEVFDVERPTNHNKNLLDSVVFLNNVQERILKRLQKVRDEKVSRDVVDNIISE